MEEEKKILQGIPLQVDWLCETYQLIIKYEYGFKIYYESTYDGNYLLETESYDTIKGAIDEAKPIIEDKIKQPGINRVIYYE